MQAVAFAKRPPQRFAAPALPASALISDSLDISALQIDVYEALLALALVQRRNAPDATDSQRIAAVRLFVDLFKFTLAPVGGELSLPPLLRALNCCKGALVPGSHVR